MSEGTGSQTLDEWLASVSSIPPEPGVGIEDPVPMRTPVGYPVLFPFKEPRPHQLETVDRIAQVINSGSDVLLCAGTGFGKSPTMMALASLFNGGAWLLVGKNDLVEQWKNDYQRLSHCGFFKARGQFRCEMVPGKTCGEAGKICKDNRNGLDAFIQGSVDRPPLSVATAMEFDSYANAHGTKSAEVHFREAARTKRDTSACPYEKNRDYSLSKGMTIMTVAMALTVFSYLRFYAPVRKRALMVIDECSEIEGELLNFYEIQVSTKTIAKLVGSAEIFLPDHKGNIEAPPPRSLHEALQWVNSVENFIDARVKWMTEQGVEMSDEDEDEISNFKRKLKAIADGLTMSVPYYYEVEDTGAFSNNPAMAHGSYIVRIKPLEARGLFDQTLGQFADHFVFTSATTGTPALFNATHGRARPLQYLEVLSTFPVAARPILVAPVANMSFKTINSDLPLMTAAILKIANDSAHKNQKGLIHTFTNRITDAVAQEFVNAGLARRIIVLKGGGPARRDQMRLFRNSKEPLILISPSAMMGISLDDDLARWQVVSKVPYPNFSDVGISYRKDNIPDWYSWQTSKDLIQSFGRIVRSPVDWGTTYVLDRCFINHYKHNMEQFPGFIREAIQFL